jgi:hypothetical protein
MGGATLVLGKALAIRVFIKGLLFHILLLVKTVTGFIEDGYTCCFRLTY